MENKRKKFLEVLKKQHGNVSRACEAFGITRTTYYAWLKEEKFRENSENLLESLIDEAESSLHELIRGVTVENKAKGKEEEVTVYKKAPDAYSVVFFLKTRGKKRGYIETIEQETTLKGDSLKIIVEYGNPKGE
jgi:hypothetical protein